MSSQIPFHHHLLRPAIIHILRAAGFHSTRPSVLDTLTDLAARYLSLLAQRTAYFVYDRTTSDPLPLEHNLETAAVDISVPPILRTLDGESPTITDIRLAMTACAVFSSSNTATEEIWQEMLRKPVTALPAIAQEKEQRRRDYEDTRDVREFLDWVVGPVNQEIRRIAGLFDEQTALTSGTAAGSAAAAAAPTIAELVEPKEDYLAQMKKKRSKTGESSRFAGTALGRVEDRGGVKIEGGPESLEEWQTDLKKRRLEGLEEEASKKRREAVT